MTKLSEVQVIRAALESISMYSLIPTNLVSLAEKALPLLASFEKKLLAGEKVVVLAKRAYEKRIDDKWLKEIKEALKLYQEAGGEV